MSNAALCQQAVAEVGSGIAASLRGVDCVTMGATQAAFGRLFGASGILLPALTLLLTLYVAFFAIQLLTGRSRLGIGALTPRIMTIGLVLTFATSWIAYSQVVWNLALGAPNEIASILTGVRGNATDVFAQKVDILFGVVGEAAEGAKQQAAQTAQGGGEVAAAIKAAMPTSMFSPEGMLWMGSMLLVLGTAGVLVATRIALAVMIALGPLFVVLALFNGTRGLFTGWLKGMVLLALAPLFAVLGGSLMLELAVPVINALTEIPGQLDPRAAMAFFVLGVVHVALMALVMKIATTMVGGWTVFGLAQGESERGNDLRPAQPAVQVQQPASASAGGGGNQRRIAISGVPAANAANDIGGAALASHRTSHVYAIAGDRAASPLAASGSTSRSRGIGSRFRAAPARSTEKIR